MKTRAKAIAPAAIALLAAILQGCASHPDSIVPESVSAEPYEGLSCQGLEEELTRAENDLAEVSKRQENKRTQDAVGNVLLLPGLMSLAKDSREAVAFHKGEVATLRRELDVRGCGTPEPVAEVDQAESEGRGDATDRAEKTDQGEAAEGDEATDQDEAGDRDEADEQGETANEDEPTNQDELADQDEPADEGETADHGNPVGEGESAERE